MYSAPRIATANACGWRFKVETMTSPPGFASAASASRAAAGSGTCSSISMQVTTSKAPGRSRARSSAATPAIVDRSPGLQRVQFGDLEHRRRQIDSEHPRAGARHGFGENAAAAADVENLLAAAAPRALDVSQPQRIQIRAAFWTGRSDPTSSARER